MQCNKWRFAVSFVEIGALGYRIYKLQNIVVLQGYIISDSDAMYK